jgi:hypothetical protein
LSRKADAPSNVESSSSPSSSSSSFQQADNKMASFSSSPIPAQLQKNSDKKSSTTDNTKTVLIDEIKQYCDCRYIGPSEACYRLFGLKMHAAKPAVVRMQVHLPEKQDVYYEEGKEGQILNDAKNPPHSQLLGYFDAVKAARLPNAKAPK